ncbi:MAG: transglycosylase SLT domain-containing protein [Gammaproteobacteria bacterium]
MLIGALAACGQQAPSENSSLGHKPEETAALQSPVETMPLMQAWTGDLDGMRQRRLIRVAVPNSGFFYYIDNGRQRGTVAESIRLLEKFVNTRFGLKGSSRIKVIAVPLTRDRLLPALVSGEADIASGGLTVTRSRSEEIAFSKPILTDIREVVVTGPLALPVSSLDDLSAREVVVRASSSYFESLQRLSQRLVAAGMDPVVVIPAHEVFEADDLLEMTAAGMIGITVCDDYVAEFWRQVYPDLTVHRNLAVREGASIAWAFRRDSPQLKALVDEFISKNGVGTETGNVIRNRYLGNPKRVSSALASDRIRELTSNADVFRKYADEYGFDWLQLAAQAYQESRLNNDTVSSAGAVGIMQVLPATAAAVGVKNFKTLDGSVRAGARYMRKLADEFDDGRIDSMDQWLLALASYNAGETRIRKLRRRAQANGLDPDKWFDNVEVEVRKSVGSETVNYVRRVMQYYLAYKLTLDREQLRQEVLQRVHEERG